MTTLTATKKIDDNTATQFVNSHHTMNLLRAIDEYDHCAGIGSPIENITHTLHNFIESDEYKEMMEDCRSSRLSSFFDLIRFLPPLLESYNHIKNEFPDIIKAVRKYGN